MSWHSFAAFDEVQDGGPAVIREISGKSVGVFRRGDDLHAVLNHCPHAGAPICEGVVTGRVTCENGTPGYDAEALTLRCPWHRWEFDLPTGRAVAPIPQRLRLYPVRVNGAAVEVKVG